MVETAEMDQESKTVLVRPNPTTTSAEEHHSACLSFSKHSDRLTVKAGVGVVGESNAAVWLKASRAQIETLRLSVHSDPQP